MAKNGMVNLNAILDELPGGVTLSDIRPVTKGKVNFPPEQVDDIIAEIKENHQRRTGSVGLAQRPEPLVGASVIPEDVREEVLAGKPLGQLSLGNRRTAAQA